MPWRPPFLSTAAARPGEAKGVNTQQVPYTPIIQGLQQYPIKDDWSAADAGRAPELVTWVFRAVNAIASNQASLTAIMRQGNAQDGPEEDHPVLDLLNRNPNPAQEVQYAWVWRYMLTAQILLNKRGAFIEVTRSRGGDVISLSLLPPDKTAPIPDPQKFVSAYEVNLGAKTYRLPAEQVIWVKLPHPFDPYNGMTPLEACGLAAEGDYLAKQFNKQLMANGGQRPGGILNVKGGFRKKEDQEEVKARFLGPALGGPAGAGRMTVLGAEDLEYIDTSVNPRDVEWSNGRAVNKDEIYQAFGVPESVAGNASGRTFDNADAERSIFWEQTMLPHLTLIARALDRLDGNPDLFLDFDVSGVDALQKAEQLRREQLLEEYNANIIPREFYLRETGRDPADVGEGTFKPTPQPFALPGAAPAAPGSPPDPQADPNAPTDPPAPPKALKATKDADQVTWGKWTVDRKLVDTRRHANTARLKSWEAHARESMVSLFTRQRTVVLEKLGGQKTAQKIARKDLGADDLFDMDRWDAQLDSDATAWVTAVVSDFGGDVARSLGADWSLTEPVRTAIAKRVNKIVGVNDTTYQGIKDALAKGLEEGSTPQELANLVSGVFDQAVGYRAEMIARTEVTGAAGEGQLQGAAQSDVATEKAWLSASDDRVRGNDDKDEFDHVEADGETVPLDDPFTATGEDLDHPGDQAGSPGNVINCRCTMVIVAGDEPTF